MRRNLDGFILVKAPHQVTIWDRYGLQVDVGGFRLPRASRSRTVETKFLASWAPLKHILLDVGDERVMRKKPGVAEDNE